jgi:hypothetical protein
MAEKPGSEPASSFSGVITRFCERKDVEIWIK